MSKRGIPVLAHVSVASPILQTWQSGPFGGVLVSNVNSEYPVAPELSLHVKATVYWFPVNIDPGER